MGFLEEILAEDKKIYYFVTQNIKNIEPHLENISNVFSEYTDHSPKHSKAVLDLGYLLNNEKLNIYEKAIFTLAAYFHDIGMDVSNEKIEEFKNKISDEINFDYLVKEFSIRHQLDLQKLSKEDIRHYIALDHFRIIHAELSEQYIKKKYSKSERENHIEENYLWNYVGVICRGHNLTYHEILNNNNDYSVEYYLTNGTKINVLYLTVLLRMADICHFSYDRALPFIYVIKDFKSRYSKSIWSYHTNLVRAIPDKGDCTIKVQADCDNFIHHREIIKYSNYIQEELFNSHKLLNEKKSKYKLLWKFVDHTLIRNVSPEKYIFEESKYRLDTTKIINLLMGERLYSVKLFSIRECIQNSLDAIKVCKNKIPNNHYIYIDLHDQGRILDIYDSGTGMDLEIFKNNFLSLGTRSFWKSWKAIQCWDIKQDKINLIAEHGIGNISYFMIADKIEIFSKYHYSQKPMHVIIEDYNDFVEFMPTKIDNFPSFEGDSYASPWDIGHGTCIRFYLKENIEFTELAKFLSDNIIRVSETIILRGEEENVLPNVWFLNNSNESSFIPGDLRPYNYIESKNSVNEYKDIQEKSIIKQFFTNDNFYDGDPRDNALTNNYLVDNNYKTRININYGEQRSIPSRISQNGILIKNASEFIYKNTDNELLFEQYGIDIDVVGEYCFQLDAERTNIIDNEYNKNIIGKILPNCFQKYIELISTIESPIYFPCGGSYYHGLEDILTDENRKLCFHEQFVRHFNENLLNDLPELFQALLKSKLYLIGKERNSSLNVNDICSMNEPKLLIIKSKRKITKKFVKKVISEMDDNTAYYPDIETPFLLPIFLNFKLGIIKNFPEFMILNLTNEKKPDNSNVLLSIEKLVDQEFISKG